MIDPYAPLGEHIRKAFVDAEIRLAAALWPTGKPADTADQPTVEVETASAYVPVSDELLMDVGAIPDIRPPVHYPWRTRLRWRIQAWREKTGRWAYRRISGLDFPDVEDW